jgi:hypothetical protein
MPRQDAVRWAGSSARLIRMDHRLIDAGVSQGAARIRLSRPNEGDLRRMIDVAWTGS